jgi:cell division protein FtsB
MKMFIVALLSVSTPSAFAGIDFAAAPAPAPSSGPAPANAKQAAVTKVVEMLENLQREVVEEGEKEAVSYDKFACFCKSMTIKKTRAIKKGKDEKEELSAEIEKLSKERDALDKKITKLNEEIEKTEKEMAAAKAKSDEEFALYEKNEADLSAALYGLDEAIKVLKSSNKASFAQLQSISKTVRTATMLADALGLRSAKGAAMVFLQQAPEVEMEDYKFHSSGIIETLEDLRKDFEKVKNTVDADEVKRVADYNINKQQMTDKVKADTHEMEESKDLKDRKIADIAENSEELTTVSAQLADDIQYLNELSKGCEEKAITWDQRSRMRIQELTAITEAMDIVAATVMDKTSSKIMRLSQVGSTLHTADAVASSEGALEAIEDEAESIEAESPASFLQKLASLALPRSMRCPREAKMLASR